MNFENHRSRFILEDKWLNRNEEISILKWLSLCENYGGDGPKLINLFFDNNLLIWSSYQIGDLEFHILNHISYMCIEWTNLDIFGV